MGREEVPSRPWAEGWCLLLGFLRDDSLPLASERSGEPGRLSECRDDNFLAVSGSLLRGNEVFANGVFVPMEEVPEGCLSPSLALSFPCLFSSTLLPSSSFSFSASLLERSDSLCLG